MSLYIEDFSEAIEFYEQVFGPPETVDEAGGIYGWRMGATWLTLFPSEQGSYKGSNLRNAEFAIQVSKPEEVDVLLFHDLQDLSFGHTSFSSCWVKRAPPCGATSGGNLQRLSELFQLFVYFGSHLRKNR